MEFTLTLRDRTRIRPFFLNPSISNLFSALSIALMTPLAIKNLFFGKYVLSLLILLFIVAIITRMLAIKAGKEAQLTGVVVLVLMVATNLASIHYLGLYGVFWIYPSAIVCFFLLPRATANLFALSLTGLTAAMSWPMLDHQIVIRLVASAGLTILFLNVAVGVISSQETRLIKQSLLDPLTGVFNRRHMETCLRDATDQFSDGGQTATLLLIDIDNFKSINDRFGHTTGDAVICEVADLLMQNSAGTAPLFRLGGEEFILLLDKSDSKTAMLRAEKLRRIIERADILTGRPVSVSIGVAEVRADQSTSHWIRDADKALYLAKNSGRNQVRCA
ncbi:sensor domain-containing diguanylate cyclase [Candidatus Halocynthiibacter alkanivorans]|uniref:GGDEF domain-containing protein n=1 Tax=Candidatus Halocynthiibacter alkanivorans TaxID=2267619 RepID=UPI000DF2941E|nr:GGDEF domain-containing protein [Candidatus Halocynthiibacter alkanivorans]